VVRFDLHIITIQFKSICELVISPIFLRAGRVSIHIRFGDPFLGDRCDLPRIDYLGESYCLGDYLGECFFALDFLRCGINWTL